MLSVITHPGGSVAGLAGLLSDLVPGAVSGLVRDVLVLDTGPEDVELANLCEAAGARRVKGGLGLAIREARSDQIFLAAPGLRLDAFALDRLGRELADLGPGGVARGLALTSPAPFGLGVFARAQGLVTIRSRILGLAAGTSLEALLSQAARGAVRLRVAG